MNEPYKPTRRRSALLQDAAASGTASQPPQTFGNGRTDRRSDRRTEGRTQGQTEGRTEEATPARQRAGPTISLKGRALRLITGREHSRLELERKLAPHEEAPGELARILDDLQAKDFINEGRVIESVLHRRAGRLGAARIKHELQGKGLAAEAVAQAVQALKGTEVERAREIWRKKFGSPAEDATERARQMRFLAARGFSGDVIRRVVESGDD